MLLITLLLPLQSISYVSRSSLTLDFPPLLPSVILSYMLGTFFDCVLFSYLGVGLITSHRLPYSDPPHPVFFFSVLWLCVCRLWGLFCPRFTYLDLKIPLSLGVCMMAVLPSVIMKTCGPSKIFEVVKNTRTCNPDRTFSVRRMPRLPWVLRCGIIQIKCFSWSIRSILPSLA